MGNTNEKKKRTVGFKLGLVQAIIYLVLFILFVVFGLMLMQSQPGQFIDNIGTWTTSMGIDLDGDGNYDDAEIEASTDRAYSLHINNDYYKFVSEDRETEQWIFTHGETGENITVKFKQIELYETLVHYEKTVRVTGIILLACVPVMALITVLQFVVAAKGSKSHRANNLGIVLNSIFVGGGILGLIGAIKDRKLALCTDEKYLARKRAKEQKRLEREEREKAESEGSTFTGGAFANAGINILTGFVCLITLGLAYPAMVCWKLRWKCRHTFVSGRQLVFDGNGAQLIGKYLLWLFLSLITLGIYYVVSMKISIAKWQTKHTHFADTVIGKDDKNLSRFDGHWYQLLGVNWLCNFVTTITLSFGRYWAHCYKERWFCKHKTIDGLALKFDGKAVQYFGKKFVWNLLTVITLGIYAFWLAVKTEKWTCSHTKIKEEDCQI